MPQDDSPFEIIARFQRTLPVDVNGIASALGVKVLFSALGDAISGQIVRDRSRGGPAGFVILVNSGQHRNRQRFTLAHEIAHFILHRDLIESGVIDDTLYRSEQLSTRQESEANRLAADILMPIMQVKKLALNGENTMTLARMFGVSEQAMKIRVDSLHLSNKQGTLF